MTNCHVWPELKSDPTRISTQDSDIQVFDVDHLDHKTSKGLWRVSKKRKLASYFRPCLVLKGFKGGTALVMVGSSQPSIPYRWIPFPSRPHLAGQPPVTVGISPLALFYHYLCFSHVLHVKPVVSWAEMPLDQNPGIVHVSYPMINGHVPELVCTNRDELLSLHANYRKSTRAVSVKVNKTDNADDDAGNDAGDLSDSNKPTPNGALTFPPIEGMKFVLNTFTSNIKLDQLENEEVAKKDVDTHSRYLSERFGRPIRYLRYEGSPEHMQMVAEEATTGVWSFDDDSDSDANTRAIFRCQR
ncbi:hypothetical protein V8E54_008709 [Elaphomyces granulatus]